MLTYIAIALFPMMSSLSFAANLPDHPQKRPEAPPRHLQRVQVNGCRTLIDAPNFASVHSSPESSSNNRIGNLETRQIVQVVRQRHEWLQINAPVKGWIVVQQTTVSCIPSDGSAAVAFENIAHLRDRAIRGDRHAADTLIRYSAKADSSIARAISRTLAQWAEKNPKFLLAVLDAQAAKARERAIILLDYSLTPKERRPFEVAIAQRSPNAPSRQAWQSRQSLYKK